jgi:hypothetical protein
MAAVSLARSYAQALCVPPMYSVWVEYPNCRERRAFFVLRIIPRKISFALNSAQNAVCRE